MKRSELDALKSAITAKRQSFDSLKAIGAAILAPWDGLTSIGRATIGKLLPTLAARLEELRNAIRGNG
jgi:hypothetical protein